MARYEVRITSSAAKELETVSSKRDRQRIVAKIRPLGDEPRPPGCQRVSGQDRYRVRQGRYRIIYSIEDDQLLVVVVRVADRKDVYRRTH